MAKVSRGLLLLLGLAVANMALAISVPQGWTLLTKAEQGDKSALQTLVERYKTGDPEAATAIGVLYVNGVLYPRNLNKARTYFEWARNQGSGWASFWLGLYYASTIQPEVRDLKKLAKYIEEGYERGYPGAQAVYAQLVAAGLFPGGLERAEELLEQAVATGDPVALNVEARRLAGNPPPGLEDPLEKARKLWARASRVDYFFARSFYASALYFGLGGPPDQQKGLKLARPFVGFAPPATLVWVHALYFGRGGVGLNKPKACQLANAQKNLDAGLRAIWGLCLLEGIEPGGRDLGYAHLLKAATRIKFARNLALEWKSKLTPEEIAKAKKLLKDLK